MPRCMADRAGTDDFLDAQGPQQFEDGVDLLFAAGDLDDVRLWPDIDDLAAKDVDDVDHLGARLLVRRDLDERHLAFDVRAVGEIADLDDADELVELLLDLFEHLIVAARHQRDARDGRVERLGDRQALDVEATSAEEPGDAGEHAELVLHQHRYRMAHGLMLAVRGAGAGGAAARHYALAPRRRRAMLVQNLHDAVLADQLALLQLLLLDLLLRRQVELAVELRELLLERQVLFVVAA